MVDVIMINLPTYALHFLITWDPNFKKFLINTEELRKYP